MEIWKRYYYFKSRKANEESINQYNQDIIEEYMTSLIDNKIHSIAFVDISYSWGPAIHFVELWNEYTLLSNAMVIGYAVLERNRSPYTKLEYKLKPFRIANNKTNIRRRLGKIVFDVYLFVRFLLIKRTTVYIRQSNFGLLLLAALLMRRHKVYLEMNGLAKEDNINSKNQNNYFKVVYCEFIERLYMMLPKVSVISVANNISNTIIKRYKLAKTYTIPNGCSTKLVGSINSLKSINNNIFNIGFLGTFTPWDGHERTIELYEVIRKIKNNVKMHIAGPNYRKTAIYEKYKNNDDFLFYGEIKYTNLKDFYEKLDAAYGFNRIDRSKNVEQSALKLLEYWACKLPILSTAAKGNEFIEKYKIGYLVKEDEMNNQEKFRSAVKKFLESLDEYKQNYEYAPLPRTWRDVAEDTKKILNV